MEKEAKTGMMITFSFNGKEYQKELLDIEVYKKYSWFGDLGFGLMNDNKLIAFTLHGDLSEDNEPVMSGLAVQVDGEGHSLHDYVRENITFSNT